MGATGVSSLKLHEGHNCIRDIRGILPRRVPSHARHRRLPVSVPQPQRSCGSSTMQHVPACPPHLPLVALSEPHALAHGGLGGRHQRLDDVVRVVGRTQHHAVGLDAAHVAGLEVAQHDHLAVLHPHSTEKNTEQGAVQGNGIMGKG